MADVDADAKSDGTQQLWCNCNDARELFIFLARFSHLTSIILVGVVALSLYAARIFSIVMCSLDNKLEDYLFIFYGSSTNEQPLLMLNEYYFSSSYATRSAMINLIALQFLFLLYISRNGKLVSKSTIEWCVNRKSVSYWILHGNLSFTEHQTLHTAFVEGQWSNIFVQ